MAEKKRERKPQEYYDQIKERFAEERDLRLGYRPQGTQQFTLVPKMLNPTFYSSFCPIQH